MMHTCTVLGKQKQKLWPYTQLLHGGYLHVRNTM